MIFPLWKFWTYTPWGFAAAIVWNVTEVNGIRCPFATALFGSIMDRPGKRGAK